MALARFIRSNEGAIIAEWESFARTSGPAGLKMDRSALRDHIIGMLRFVAADLEAYRTERQRSEMSKGEAPKEGGSPDTAAETHADLRFKSGFDTVQMLSEFRALRASVIKLWSAERKIGCAVETDGPFPELIRFNEAIDQIMFESVTRFTERIDRSGNLFLGTLVHDFRNPLSAIYGAAEVLLLKGKLDEEQVRLVTQIETSAARINELAANLIDVFRVRVGNGMPITTAAMDFAPVVYEAAREIQVAHPEREIVISTSGDLIGQWDHARVEQLLSNLIGNAVQHGKAASSIGVSAGGSGHEVVLSVHNEGVIPADAMRTLFEPLTRAEGEDPGKTTSLGLGLFIAKEIVHAHGGQLAVTSNDAEGTTFTAHIPRLPAAQHPGH